MSIGCGRRFEERSSESAESLKVDTLHFLSRTSTISGAGEGTRIPKIELA
jgi:hypothetical protein